MAAIPGTQLASAIVPNDSLDQYGTHYDTYGIGGFRVVPTASALAAIPAPMQKVGMWAVTADLLQVWQLITLGSPPVWSLINFSSSYTATQNQTSAVTINSPNQQIFFNATAGPITQTVPPLGTFESYVGAVKFKFWKTDSSVNPVNIVLTSPDTFNGAFTTPIQLTSAGSSLIIEANYALNQWLID